MMDSERIIDVIPEKIRGCWKRSEKNCHRLADPLFPSKGSTQISQKSSSHRPSALGSSSRLISSVLSVFFQYPRTYYNRLNGE